MLSFLKFLLYTLFNMLIVYGESPDDQMLLSEFGPKRLYPFSGIKDQVIFHWPAHSSTNNYIVQFIGTINQTGSGISVVCEPVNATAIIRLNGIPLPNPRNAYIPDFTFVENDGYLLNGSYFLSNSPQENIYQVFLNVTSTEATDFYVVLFLPYTLQKIDVSGLTKECKYYMTVKIYAVNDTKKNLIENKQPQLSGVHLARQQKSLFQVTYLPAGYNFNLSGNNVESFYWFVSPLTDGGGTLDISLKLSKSSFMGLTHPMSVFGCLTGHASTFQNRSESCLGISLEVYQLAVNDEIQWHIPFPSSGTWMLDFTLHCNISSESNCSDGVYYLELSVSIGSCVDACNTDKNHGDCHIYRNDAVLFTACKCKVGWMGLACNDGRNALSYGTQLLHTLLLTLSNFMFIPCVALAVYRKFYTEALVYFFVTFMSTFYHACDQPGQVVYCLLPYETLQFSDFLSSITAIWFTLIAVAKLPSSIQSFLQVLGLIAFAVCVSFARFNVWTTVVPAVVGLLVVVCQWGIKCHKLKHCYPGRKKTLFSTIPGLISAGVGLILYAFVETSENYYIVHSFWHILMATSVLFLLPIKHKNKSNVFKAEYTTNMSPDSSVKSDNILTRFNINGSLSSL